MNSIQNVSEDKVMAAGTPIQRSLQPKGMTWKLAGDKADPEEKRSQVVPALLALLYPGIRYKTGGIHSYRRGCHLNHNII